MDIEFLKYFWTYEDDLPSGMGNPMFGWVHLCYLGAGILLVGIFLWKYRRWRLGRKGSVRPEGVRRSMAAEVVAGSFPPFLIVIRTIYVLCMGKPLLYELPLHLCSMAGILCLLHCIRGWDWMGQVLYSLCLPGTVLALLFPDWLYYPAVHFITLEGFLFHFGIVAYVGCQLMAGKIVPSLGHIWKVILFLLVITPMVYMFDLYFDVNYMFVHTPSAGSPLEWLAGFLGVPGYLWGYGFFALLGMVIMDGGYLLCRRWLN